VGGGLLAVYILQVLLHVATAGLVGWTTRVRFGPTAGLLAVALFLALTETAYAPTRVLANTLQVFLVAIVWWRWAVLSEHGFSWSRALILGALLGVLALALPPAIMLVPLYGLWLWYHAGPNWSTAIRGLAGVGVALLCIAPATLHNLLLHGQFIPITAHGGITLRQGNGPTAGGIGDIIPGVRPARMYMHEDAARVFEHAHGRPGTWREIDAHFRREAIDYWLHNPLPALRLFAFKFYFYLTFQNYDDGMMPVAIEREDGLANRALLAPLAIPWLLGAAFVGALAMMRRPVRRFPEWVLFLLPLVIVLAFFYSPRYRVVGTPLFCGLAAYALTQYQNFRCPQILSVAGFALPPLLLLFNANTGIDRTSFMRERFVQPPAQVQGSNAGPRGAARRAPPAVLDGRAPTR
jgi:4-amino-4-deoxy-L-arabinose transferase-like glycosyltransferase